MLHHHSCFIKHLLRWSTSTFDLQFGIVQHVFHSLDPGVTEDGAVDREGLLRGGCTPWGRYVESAAHIIHCIVLMQMSLSHFWILRLFLKLRARRLQIGSCRVRKAWNYDLFSVAQYLSKLFFHLLLLRCKLLNLRIDLLLLASQSLLSDPLDIELNLRHSQLLITQYRSFVQILVVMEITLQFIIIFPWKFSCHRQLPIISVGIAGFSGMLLLLIVVLLRRFLALKQIFCNVIFLLSSK